ARARIGSRTSERCCADTVTSYRRFSSVRRLCVAALLVAETVTVSARADDAQALFDRGLKDMLAGRYSTGCSLIAESEKLDPRPGTLFTLAECYAKAGKLATALAHYGDFLAMHAAL